MVVPCVELWSIAAQLRRSADREIETSILVAIAIDGIQLQLPTAVSAGVFTARTLPELIVITRIDYIA